MNFFGRFVVAVVVGNAEGVAALVDVNDFYRPEDGWIDKSRVFGN